MAPESGFTHRQTLAGVVRFNSSDLHEAASRVTQAGVHALGAEAAHLETLTDQAIRRREAIAASCDVLARIDVAAALADHAMSHNRSEEHTSELQSLMRISSSVFCLK